MNRGRLGLPERRPISGPWRIRRFPGEGGVDPEQVLALAATDRFDDCPATVPSTVASAFRDAGRFDVNRPEQIAELGALDRAEHWYVCRFEHAAPSPRPVELAFEGLATRAEVFLNGRLLFASANMFEPRVVDVTGQVARDNVLAIRFRALEAGGTPRFSRARWRTRLADGGKLRGLRTTLLGRMESWWPAVPAVGPWRGIDLITREETGWVVESQRVSVSVDLGARQDAEALGRGARGRVAVDVEISVPVDAQARPAEQDARFTLAVAGAEGPLAVEWRGDGTGRLRGEVEVADVELWWPHTQSIAGAAPRRYPVELRGELGAQSSALELTRVGFRSLERLPGPGFGLAVNGQPVFCRGTCWTPVDALALAGEPATLRAALEQVRASGANMLRVVGTGVYESDAFYALCDELGILVWQDLMFATFDYPTQDDEFRASVESEVSAFLARTQARACLSVLCGNSEGQQQPALLGLEAERWASEFFDRRLPELCDTARPDVLYRVSTPGVEASDLEAPSLDCDSLETELPFRTRAGTCHYFGVGAYRRSLSDAALAKPAFMTECLAFSNLPGLSGADATDPERVPRDRGADWDFGDVTRFYVDALFRERDAEVAPRANDAVPEARSDRDSGPDHDLGPGPGPEREAFLLRATSAFVMEYAQTVWRDPRSGCRGAIVLTHRDPWSCAGWGVIDAEGRPKSAYYGLARAWAPVRVGLLDEGLNGLRLLLWNDPATPLSGTLETKLLKFDGTIVDSSEVPVSVPARGCLATSVDALFGGFLDSSYAYRFGPRAFDVCVARLRDAAGNCLSQTLHLPSEFGALAAQDLGLEATWRSGGAGGGGADGVLELVVSAGAVAQCVVIELEGGRARDNFFHLAPDEARVIGVELDESSAGAAGAAGGIRGGQMLALNALGSTRIPAWPEPCS